MKKVEIDEIIDRFHVRFSKYIGRLMPRGRALILDESTWPPMDIYETTNDFWISVEVPGVDKGSVKLSLAGNDLIIEGEKNIDSHLKKRNYHLIERTYGNFKRIVTLPPHLALKKVEAKFDNGILTIQIPKNEKKIEWKEIEIK